MLEINFTEIFKIGIREGLIIGGIVILIAEAINLGLKLFRS